MSWKMTDKMEFIGEFKVIPIYNVNIWCLLLDVLLHEKNVCWHCCRQLNEPPWCLAALITETKECHTLK